MIEHLTPTTVFKCLADETRVRIALLIAREGELCVCELTCALDESQPKISRHLAMLRTELGQFPRQVSGYGLDALLPENGFDVRRAFAGSEGTWGLVLAAKMRLVAEPAHTSAVVLGYPDMVAAARDAPLLRDFPVAASFCGSIQRRYS